MKCFRCSEDAAPGRTLCESHLELRRIASQKHREKMLAAGLCVECGSEPLAPGSIRYGERCLVLGRKVIKPWCPICKVKGHVRKDHKLKGLCWYCPKKVLLGSNLCPRHHEARLIHEG